MSTVKCIKSIFQQSSFDPKSFVFSEIVNFINVNVALNQQQIKTQSYEIYASKNSQDIRHNAYQTKQYDKLEEKVYSLDSLRIPGS